jgi:serine/threonine protein kinase HipA of HipAB toxin-antitoxin module
MDDEQGQFIAKFPSTTFPGVSENEFANLALAAAIGMEVPERELVEKSDFEGIPEEFNTLEGKALLVNRFDREAKGERIHIKDLPQVFGVYPSRKYECRRLSRHSLGHWCDRLLCSREPKENEPVYLALILRRQDRIRIEAGV